MPSIGILNETIADEAEGEAVMFGTVQGIDTSSFSIGDELYVSTTSGEWVPHKGFVKIPANKSSEFFISVEQI